MRFSVLLSCAFFVIALGVTPVRAHDIYTNVKNKQGASCCDNRDCRPVHYRIRPWGVQMLVDDSWRTISSEKLDNCIKPMIIPSAA